MWGKILMTLVLGLECLLGGTLVAFCFGLLVLLINDAIDAGDRKASFIVSLILGCVGIAVIMVAILSIGSVW